MTEPPPFIIEEEIANWNSKYGGAHGDKTTEKKSDKNVDNDIDFEDGNDASKDRKASNVHDPGDRKKGGGDKPTVVNGSSKTILAPKLLSPSMLFSNFAFILVVKFIVV